MRLNPSSPTFQNDLANLQANIKKVSSGGSGIYTQAQEKAINDINYSISKNAAYKSVEAAQSFTSGVLESLKNGDGLSDISAINQFQKVIDEGAVTRDQDVKLVQSAQSFINTLKTKIAGLAKGDKLSDAQRSQMRQLVQQMYEAKQQNLQNNPYINSQLSRVSRFGININDTILGELGGFDSQKTSDLSSRVQSAGYDYEAMRADGYSDAEIEEAINQ